jgi:para-aminobenzoate synthetase component 1
MTGAPKIKAMQLCSELEKIKRGVYAGAIGYFAGDGLADLSVVIRTIIMRDNEFEFQVGGAIVNDSEEISEWQETMTKATAICKTLNIDLDKMRML